MQGMSLSLLFLLFLFCSPLFLFALADALIVLHTVHAVFLV